MLEALHDVRPSPEADGTPDNAVLPEIALDLTHLPATPLGPTVPVPQMQPRAMFPFGWSRGDMRRGALLGFTLLAGLVFLWRVQAILPPFLIAFGLAALLDPTLRYNERRGRPRVYTILMLYMLALSLLAITGLLGHPRNRAAGGRHQRQSEPLLCQPPDHAQRHDAP